jgi:hypothetical protein
MQRILDLRFCLLGVAASLFFATGCDQGEGDRCQIDSDCASGLRCSDGQTGNGTCVSSVSPPTTTVDGSAVWDGSGEVSVGATFDADLDAAIGTLADGGGISVDSDGTSVDTSAVDASAE